MGLHLRPAQHGGAARPEGPLRLHGKRAPLHFLFGASWARGSCVPAARTGLLARASSISRNWPQYTQQPAVTGCVCEMKPFHSTERCRYTGKLRSLCQCGSCGTEPDVEKDADWAARNKSEQQLELAALQSQRGSVAAAIMAVNRSGGAMPLPSGARSREASKGQPSPTGSLLDGWEEASRLMC